MNKIKIGIVTALAALALGACGQAQTSGNRPATANTTADAPAPAPPSSWSSTGDSPETSESPASSPDAKPMTKQSSTKEAAVKGCIGAFAKKLDVRPDTLTFKPVKVGKSVAAGGPHYYTVVGWLSSPELSGGRWSICDGIKIVNGEVVPEKYPRSSRSGVDHDSEESLRQPIQAPSVRGSAPDATATLWSDTPTPADRCRRVTSPATKASRSSLATSV